jgi:hypothetical protein
MAEPIGGREFDWRKLIPSNLAAYVHLSAIILGWGVILVLPLVFAASLLKETPWVGFQFPYKELGSLAEWDLFWKPFLSSSWKIFAWALGLFLSTSWFIVALFCTIFLRRSIKQKNMNNEGTPNHSSPSAKEEKNAAAPASVVGGASSAQPEGPATAQAQPVPPQASKEALERELKEKIKSARKEFEEKFAKLKGAIPSKYEFNEQVDTLDLGTFFSESGLKGEMRASLLRTYLSLEPGTLRISVNDPASFCREDKCTLRIDVTDPVMQADPDLRDQSIKGELTVVILASYPSSMKKFVEWKEKAKTLLRLKNVRQGELMSVCLADELGIGADWASVVEVQLPAGLTYDVEKAVLSGLPEVGSDMKIVTIVECKGAPRARLEVVFLLTCNMDPELRWKEIQETDSDKPADINEEKLVELAKMAEAVRSTASSFDIPKPDDTFSKPHRVSRRAQSGGFDLAYASIRGRSHIKSGSFREDDVEFSFFEEGRAVAIVVSDGAGSAPLSRRGSAIVAKVGVQCLVSLGKKLLSIPGALDARSSDAVEGFASAVRAIRSQIEFEADCIQKQRPEFQAKEMYATFLAALVLPTPSGDVLLTYSAGDGAIGIGLAGAASGLKCVPDHGVSAGQTLFILNKGADDAEKRLMHTRLPDAYALMLVSDGVSDPRIPHGQEADPEVWNKLAEELKPLAAKEPVGREDEVSESYKNKGPLCGWLDSYEKGHHDDRTVAVLYRNHS